MAKSTKSKVKTEKTPVELLTLKQAKAEHARLQTEISQADKRYYQQDRPTISDAEYDALRLRYNAIEARFPDLRTFESLSLHVGAAPTRGFKKVPPRHPDAVARQCLCRAGRDRVCRPHPQIPQAERRREDRVFRRAEDRRPVDVVALRAGRIDHGRHPRRWRRGRGRHRQYPHAQAGAAAPERPPRAADRRGARRGLHDQGRFP